MVHQFGINNLPVFSAELIEGLTVVIDGVIIKLNLPIGRICQEVVRRLLHFGEIFVAADQDGGEDSGSGACLVGGVGMGLI